MPLCIKMTLIELRPSRTAFPGFSARTVMFFAMERTPVPYKEVYVPSSSRISSPSDAESRTDCRSTLEFTMWTIPCEERGVTSWRREDGRRGEEEGQLWPSRTAPPAWGDRMAMFFAMDGVLLEEV